MASTSPVLQRLHIATEFQNRDVEGRIPSHAAREQPGHEAGRGPLAIDPQTFALQVFQSFQAAPPDDVRASQAVAARQGDHRGKIRLRNHSVDERRMTIDKDVRVFRPANLTRGNLTLALLRRDPELDIQAVLLEESLFGGDDEWHLAQ